MSSAGKWWLNQPEKRDDPEFLMPSWLKPYRDRKGRLKFKVKGFETSEFAYEEDLIRREALSTLIRSGKCLYLRSQFVSLRRALSYEREDADPISLASYSYMREVRRRVCGAIIKLSRSTNVTIKAFTAISYQWIVPYEQLIDVKLSDILRQFRAHLDRAGGDKAGGYVVAFIHGAFEPISKTYFLHLHGLAAGEMIGIIERLKDREAYKVTPEINRPIQIDDIANPAEQITYLLKSYWPSSWLKLEGPAQKRERQRRKDRPSEPYHCLYLLKLHMSSLDDLGMLYHLKRSGGAIIPTANAHLTVFDIEELLA